MFEEQIFPSSSNLRKSLSYTLPQEASVHDCSLKHTYDNLTVIGWQLLKQYYAGEINWLLIQLIWLILFTAVEFRIYFEIFPNLGLLYGHYQAVYEWDSDSVQLNSYSL